MSEKMTSQNKLSEFKSVPCNKPLFVYVESKSFFWFSSRKISSAAPTLWIIVDTYEASPISKEGKMDYCQEKLTMFQGLHESSYWAIQIPHLELGRMANLKQTRKVKWNVPSWGNKW